MHDVAHPHTHDHQMDAGLFHERDRPLNRDYGARSFTVGIGGPVGRGKTALVLARCRMLREGPSPGGVTKDIFTREDARFLVPHPALAAGRSRAVETRGAPPA